MVGERSAPLVLSRHVLMLGVVLMVLAPVYWMLMIGLKTESEFSQIPPTIWPQEFTLEWFEAVLGKRGFGEQIMNSIIIAVIATSIAITVGSLAAYGLSRFQLPWGLNYHILFFILTVRMFPQTVTVVPLFIFLHAGWPDRHSHWHGAGALDAGAAAGGVDDAGVLPRHPARS